MLDETDEASAAVKVNHAKSHNGGQPSMSKPEQIDTSGAGAPTSVVWRKARRVIVLVVGGTLLLFGSALLVLPGPAFIVIPAGLAILAIEFRWARRWLHKARSLLPPAKDGNGEDDPLSQPTQSLCEQPRSNSTRHCTTNSPPQK